MYTFWNAQIRLTGGRGFAFNFILKGDFKHEKNADIRKNIARLTRVDKDPVLLSQLSREVNNHEQNRISSRKRCRNGS